MYWLYGGIKEHLILGKWESPVELLFHPSVMAIFLQMHIWITVQTLINIPLSAYPSIPSDHREVENYILQYTKPKDKFYTQNTLIRRNRILKINGCEKIKNNYIIWRKKFVLKFSFAVFAP